MAVSPTMRSPHHLPATGLSCLLRGYYFIRGVFLGHHLHNSVSRHQEPSSLIVPCLCVASCPLKSSAVWSFVGHPTLPTKIRVLWLCSLMTLTLQNSPKYAVTISECHRDERLCLGSQPTHALWLALRGTVDQETWPQLSVGLSRRQRLKAAPKIPVNPLLPSSSDASFSDRDEHRPSSTSSPDHCLFYSLVLRNKPWSSLLVWKAFPDIR